MAQRIVIVWQSVGIVTNDNVEEINGLLNDGWSIASVTPMYGAGPIGQASAAVVHQVRFAAVVVLQQLGQRQERRGGGSQARSKPGRCERQGAPAGFIADRIARGAFARGEVRDPGEQVG